MIRPGRTRIGRMETAMTSYGDTMTSLPHHSTTITMETQSHTLTVTVKRILGNVQALLVPGSTKRTLTDSARLRVTETAMFLIVAACKATTAGFEDEEREREAEGCG